VRRHPEAPRFHQRGEGSRVQYAHALPTQDPFDFAQGRLFRLKNGFAQDDAIGEESSMSKPSRYRGVGREVPSSAFC